MPSRVLIVDDTATIRALLQDMLTEASAEVLAAEDGEAAMKLLASTRPDLVITDLVMPNLTGLELIQKIRATPALETLPIAVMSAQQTDANVEKCFAAGATYFLPKPFTPEEVAALLAKVERPAP